ncbi:hydrogenase [Mesorhizobium hungaricum]|jgi:Ni/Fe-hydrogenase subunit HybB-like protein|uniref:Hydrogenase n=1 Tax=Mesorhizobium hungaricum TaxID=1566387 RepID=A0A1C2E6W1_9HYPH|nr:MULTISPECIES: NrfD/PsrC family molybdoenzyme membrane anchor subunit [Mesorhizobium]MBN9237429.1 polysulfide reductase NrfD [Mesorhizobium sp.]MDQ0333358.1 molybdopterin-containing oxidoreductase family membrane subunit [Mesorhizobium sp. YL-MeA3-2017]OCX22752.1 hydrogenase [Mesorhizobium hungaricum]
MAEAVAAARRTPPHPPVLLGRHDRPEISGRIASVVLAGRLPRFFWTAFFLCFLLAMLFLYSVTYLFAVGIGSIGVNIPVAWGTMISSFVWWIGIGHAGTLISAVLLLLRQPWRASINRFAEAMTLFAVAMAGLYPILHLGRPWFFYWLLPLPNTHMHWPQWRSPLVWDFAAISTYATVSLLFWYMGLIPDLAILRDRAKRRGTQVFYGLLALGWRGSAYHWARYKVVYYLMAALATPLVVSVHSIVALDFTFAIVPGYHSTIFPPYFVAGALLSGFAMVLTIAIPLRWAFSVEDLITLKHMDNAGKLMIASGMVVIYGYASEAFFAWYSGETYERMMMVQRAVGPYSVLFWTMLACNCVALQLLWLRSVRRNMPLLFAVAVIINIGMWIERYVIVVSGPSRDFLPSAWGEQSLTWLDYGILFGSLGTFFALVFLFVRILPAITIFEVEELAEEGKGS